MYIEQEQIIIFQSNYSMKHKELIIDFSKMIAVSVLVTIIFIIFLFALGIPSTQARNLYNNAMNTQNLIERERLLQESLDIFHQSYVEEELEETRGLLGKI